VLHRAHRIRRDRGEIGVLGTRLIAIDFLQRQHVGVQGLDRLRIAGDVNRVVGWGVPVQDIE